MVSNYMFPPKYVGPVPSVPRFASDPQGAHTFYGYLITDDTRPQLGAAVGVTFSGAELSHAVGEGDVAEVEAVVEHHSAAEDSGFASSARANWISGAKRCRRFRSPGTFNQ